ncbi:MAG TPA: AsmA-like C-terminal region-containing protein [Bacteroidia bacterium]|jgi:hypothetical protein|nr:AsmA-like C-terminal region-containing protein [Bacteroidia bacterium]
MKKKKYLKRIIIFLFSIVTIPLLIAFLAITFYKKELTDLLIAKAHATYGLSIYLEDTHVSLFENWPNGAIKITNVVASSDLSKPNAPPLFKAKSISVSFNLQHLFQKLFIVNSVSLEDGTITLVKDKAGILNYKLKEQTDTAKTTASLHFDLQKIHVRNVKLDFKNEEKNKHIGVVFRNNMVRLNTQNGIVNALITGNVQIQELLFKQKKGSFLTNTEAIVYLNTNIYPNQKLCFVDPTSYAVIDEEKYGLTAYVDLKDDKKLTLKIDAPTANYKKAIQLMNTKIKKDLAKITVTNTVEVHATIIAEIGESAEPQLYVSLKGKNNDLKIGNTEIPYSHVSFTGSVFSMGDRVTTFPPNNGIVEFNNIKGKVYDFPFTASVLIKDLKDPQIKIQADLMVQGSKIKFKPGTDFILDGVCEAKIDYKGAITRLNRNDFLNAPQQLSLNMRFKKFSYKTAADQPAYVINGEAKGFNKDVSFKDLQLETVGGNFTIDGDAQDFVPYAFGFRDGFNAAIQANTDYMNLTPMIVKSFNTTTSTVSKTDVKDAMKGSFVFDISIFAKKLSIRFLTANDATVQMNYANRTLEIKNLTMKACKGTLTASGTLRNFTNIQARVGIKNMDVKTMFQQFEDFGQTTITSEKLMGNISVNAEIKATFNEKFQLKAPALNGQVQLKLKDGHLLDFEPIQRMGTYFRNRDFKDITFSEINQEFKINGTEMNIENLEIASSVLHLYIDGIYNFKGQTNLNLRVPLNNLKKRDKDYIPQNLGDEGRKAKALVLNAHGLPDKIKIGLGTHMHDTLK